LHIISRRALLLAAEKHGRGLGKNLDAWYRIAKKAEWKSLEDIRKTYASTDSVRVDATTYTIFNIGGNDFRLVVEINYRTNRIFIRQVLTHAEYDKEGWKK
jgi:mRNA interferase HigB